MSVSSWSKLSKEEQEAALKGAQADASDVSQMRGHQLADEKKRKEIEKLEIGIEKERQMMEVLKDQYYPKEEINQAIIAIAGVCDTFDAAIISELPALLAGMTEAQIEIELIKFIEAWKERRANARDDVYKAGREAVKKELRGDLKKVAARRKT